METKNSKSASTEVPEKSEACCSQEVEHNCKHCHGANCARCMYGLRKHIHKHPMAAVGAAAAAGFLLACLFDRKK